MVVYKYMKREDYTLEYYQEKEKQKKERNHITYLRKKYKLSPEEYDTVRINRKNEVLSKILEMSKRSCTNKQMAEENGIVIGTVSKYKRILKDRGFYVGGKVGRPYTLSPQSTD